MPCDLAKLAIQTLLQPISDAGIALARLDERIARSPVGEGWAERSHFADACASLWIDGELVHPEDLALHDASHDIRTPTHELTIARDVLRTRPRSLRIRPAGRSAMRGCAVCVVRAAPPARPSCCGCRSGRRRRAGTSLPDGEGDGGIRLPCPQRDGAEFNPCVPIV